MEAAGQTDRSERGDYLTDSLGLVFAVLADYLPGCCAAVYLLEGKRGELVLQKSSAPEGTFVESIPAGAVSGWSSMAGKGRPTATKVVSDEDRAQLLTSPGDHSDAIIMGHPLCTGEDQVGLLVAALHQIPDDEAQARKSLDLAAQIIQNNLVLNSQLETMHVENLFLSDLVSRASTLDISAATEALIETIVRLVEGILTFDRLTVSTQAAEMQGWLKIDRVEGLEDDYPAGFAYAAAGVLHGEVFRQATPMNIGCLEASGYEGRFAVEDFKRTRLISFLGVPIVEAGVPRGTLALESTAKDHFRPRDLDILRAIVQVYGTALCWAQRYQEVRARATVDGLTQLLNHQSFIDRFGQELERASRYSETMSFLMLDLDHFKRVNDTHGHLHGDYVLWQTAQLIRSCIRKVDTAGRYGGEEFGVIIINVSKRDSRVTAERIKNSIADHEFVNDGMVSRISVSIGMSEYPTDGDDFNTLIRCADDAMYMVKHQGGNGVISYSREQNEKERKGQ